MSDFAAAPWISRNDQEHLEVNSKISNLWNFGFRTGDFLTGTVVIEGPSRTTLLQEEIDFIKKQFL
jgi:hypothetical protein